MVFSAASTGIEEEAVAFAEQVEIYPGVRVPLATIGDLVAMKLLARDDQTRPQDRLDLRALLTTATARDLERARSALESISERGFARGRKLAALLDKTLQEFGLTWLARGQR